MTKHLKYLITLFLAFVLIAGDGTLYSQSKSEAYCKSSFVVLRRELSFNSSRVYQSGQVISRAKSGFSFVLIFLNVENVFSFENKTAFKFQKQLHQNLISFITQSVFVNEIITSGNFRESLDIA